jgi:hypothetical protein
MKQVDAWIYRNSVTGDRLGRKVVGTSQHPATSQKSKDLLYLVINECHEQ